MRSVNKWRYKWSGGSLGHIFYKQKEEERGREKEKELYTSLRTSDFASWNRWRQYFPERRSARSERGAAYIRNGVCIHIRARDAAKQGRESREGRTTYSECQMRERERERDAHRNEREREQRAHQGREDSRGGAKGDWGKTRFSGGAEAPSEGSEGHVPWK